jgi:superfamily II DNA or RNA helicase/DNA-binding XRE family transcriptional regulator
MSQENVSGWIRRLRLQLGMTQLQLGERIGVTLVTISRWETSQVRPNKLAMKALAALESSISRQTHLPATPSVSEIREPRLVYGNSTTILLPDFRAESEVIRLFVEGERLRYGHLFSPSFGIETAMIDPVPHQIIAVYKNLLSQPRLRFLLADDAGAGKTIMTGLYIREMLNRQLIRRVLIVPPAGLVGNWLSELKKFFSLEFTEINGSDCRAGNPFATGGSDLSIISLDTLTGNVAFECLAAPETQPYDLVVFDEAHKLSASRNIDMTFDTTDRYKIAELIAGVEPLEESRSPRSLPWQARHLLLLTATPHMGKDFPYYALWRLLEPNLFSTFDAFNSFSPEIKARYYLRRTKEEMVYLDGRRIYPTRESNTVSYDMTPLEKKLYEETTDYIRTYYNRAKTLNRSAAQLAMSVLQRRAASSTRALLRSLERRLERVEGYITDIMAQQITDEEFRTKQEKMPIPDIEGRTSEDEVAAEGEEQRDIIEDENMGATAANNLAELRVEREELIRILELAREVSKHDDSKFKKLLEVIQDKKIKGNKFLIFTEHRDTMAFLVERLEGLGFTGEVTSIHGGMAYQERDKQVKEFRDRCRFMVATDAAGEGINLQFCWIMINYDIPWNPARIEQRFGRIHRYKQQHDPVVLVNLIAGQTREGRVLKTLLDKLEHIRKELGSDKVFDIIGRQFQGVSLSEIIMRKVVEKVEEKQIHDFDNLVTIDRTNSVEEEDKKLLPPTGDVTALLPDLLASREREQFTRLLPGYVRRFIEKSTPYLGINIRGSIDNHFYLERLPLPLALSLDEITGGAHLPLTIEKPENEEKAIFLRPGEPFFDQYNNYFCDSFFREALEGATFTDPYSTEPYLYHLALISVIRHVDRGFAEAYGQELILESRLVALAQTLKGEIKECPVEALMFLRPVDFVPPAVLPSNIQIMQALSRANNYLKDSIAGRTVKKMAQELVSLIPERETFIRSGFDYQEADLTRARLKLRDKALTGDAAASRDMEIIRKKQREIASQKERALEILHREPELIDTGQITILAHALVLTSGDPVDKERYDAEIERTAMRVARIHEESLSAKVQDVHTPEMALAAGYEKSPGFDLLSTRADGSRRCIEVKGRRLIGDIELTENEWAKSANLRRDYWLYVVYDSVTAQPRLHRVQDPFKSLIVQAKGGVVIDEMSIFQAAEKE